MSLLAPCGAVISALAVETRVIDGRVDLLVAWAADKSYTLDVNQWRWLRYQITSHSALHGLGTGIPNIRQFRKNAAIDIGEINGCPAKGITFSNGGTLKMVSDAVPCERESARAAMGISRSTIAKRANDLSSVAYRLSGALAPLFFRLPSRLPSAFDPIRRLI